VAPRTIPVSATRANGNELTGSGWNAGPAASNTFLTSRPRVSLFSSGVSFPSGTLTPVPWNTPTLQFEPNIIDTDGGWNASQPTRYTCQVPGWYAVSGGVGFAANTTGQRMAVIRKNGADYQGGSARMNPAATTMIVAAPCVLMQLAVGDYAEMYGLQNSGGALSDNADQYSGSTLNLLWISS
jgi:hypothetical protein